jgi:hypothetical protein
MKPSQTKTLLTQTIKAGLPVLIVGKPGVGKTDVVSQAARETNSDLLISHPAVSDPTDAKGLPWAEAGAKQATFLPFGDLAQAVSHDSKKPLVWFLDDLGQASPAVQASFMQLILARRVNGHKLPDNVVFIAATNRREDRAGVSGILEPVKSRFAVIAEMEPDVDDWTNWAAEHKLRPEVIAFIRMRPELLCDFKPSGDMKNSPCPRTWSHVSKLLKLELSHGIEAAAYAGAVGEGAAMEFIGFLNMFRSLPVSPDRVLLDPEGVPVPKEPSHLYALSSALASKATENNFGRILTFAKRMPQEFAVLTVRDCHRRNPEVTMSPEFAKFTASKLGRLISGQEE